MQKEPTKKAAGKRNAGANPPRKLSRAEKKQIAEVIRQAKGDGKAHTAQQTIPYIQMYPDGICKVSEKKYSKSIAFEDINYQLAQADDKTAIFENWCDFLNYFDASVSVQLSFINQGTQREQAEKAINIPAQDDAFNSIRTEYSDMLKNQLSKGNNGLVKHKYITFSIEADNPAAAKARLARIETDVLNNFKVLGAAARPMTGYECTCSCCQQQSSIYGESAENRKRAKTVTKNRFRKINLISNLRLIINNSNSDLMLCKTTKLPNVGR